MQSSSKPDWNIGYTTRSHLCLDLDNTSLMKVYGLIDLLMISYPKIGSALILESSVSKFMAKWNYLSNGLLEKRVKRSNYHVIFNNTIPYSESCEIIECLAELGVLNHQYVEIRNMRNDMTIRVSKTVNVEYVKQKPHIVAYVSNRNSEEKGHGIRLFMALWKTVSD